MNQFSTSNPNSIGQKVVWATRIELGARVVERSTDLLCDRMQHTRLHAIQCLEHECTQCTTVVHCQSWVAVLVQVTISWLPCNMTPILACTCTACDV